MSLMSGDVLHEPSMKLKELNARSVVTEVGAYQETINKHSNMAEMTVNGRAVEVKGNSSLCSPRGASSINFSSSHFDSPPCAHLVTSSGLAGAACVGVKKANAITRHQHIAHPYLAHSHNIDHAQLTA
jgi:hypothetical protein